MFVVVTTFGFLFISLVCGDSMQLQGVNGMNNNNNLHPNPGQPQQFPMMSSMPPNSFGVPQMASGGGLLAQNMALQSGAIGQQQPLQMQNSGGAPMTSQSMQVVDSIAPPEKLQKLEDASKNAVEVEKPLLQRAAELFRSKPRIQAFTSFAEEVEKSKLTLDQKQDLYKRVSSMTSF